MARQRKPRPATTPPDSDTPLSPPPPPPPRPRRQRSRPPAPPESDTPLSPPPADDPPEYSAGASRLTVGRLACHVQREPVAWFVDGIIPARCLSFVVGAPTTGKSTCGAWLCSQARRPAILPGSEESVESALIPRLVAAGAPLERTLLLDGRLWSVPHDRAALTAALVAHRSDLLWIDPIDGYLGEVDENDGQGVRDALESLCRVATDAGVTIVAARHPGKAPGNLCPGSRQWRAVPRVIVELCVSDGPPLRRFMRIAKDPFGAGTQPREYTLLGEPGEPPRFRLGPELSRAEADVLAVGDADDRTLIEQAVALLEHLLAESEQESSWVYQAAEKESLKPRLVRLAARRLGVISRREGVGREHRAYWSLPHSGTLAQ